MSTTEPIIRTVRLDTDAAVQGECPLCAVDYGAFDLLEVAALLAAHLRDEHGAAGVAMLRYEAALVAGDDAAAREIAGAL